MPAIGTKWREAVALGLEARADSIDEWLAHTADLVMQFEDNEEISTHLLSISGILRSKRTDLLNTAKTLRNDLESLEKKNPEKSPGERNARA